MTQVLAARAISNRRLAALTALGEDARNTVAWRDALAEARMVNWSYADKYRAA